MKFSTVRKIMKIMMAAAAVTVIEFCVLLPV